MEGEGLLRGSPRHQHSHVQQTPDDQLRLKEVLTLILETLGHKQGWREGRQRGATKWRRTAC